MAFYDDDDVDTGSDVMTSLYSSDSVALGVDDGDGRRRPYVNYELGADTTDDETEPAAADSDLVVESGAALLVVFLTLYAIIFVLGISGNSLVVHVVWRNKSLQTITNIFIANLAASDIMMCLLAVPFTPISGLLSDWIFGKALCHLVPMSMAVSIYVSTMTSTAIAVDRYIAIVHPFRARMTTAGCLAVVAGIWAASVTMSLPLAVHHAINVSAETGARACLEEWPHPDIRRAFTIGSIILQYLVPCVIIIVCYWCVGVALHRRAIAKNRMTGPRTTTLASTKSNASAPAAGATAVTGTPDRVVVVVGQGQTDSPAAARSCNAPLSAAAARREQLEIRRNTRTNRMLSASVAIFVCCWLPLNCVNLSFEYNESLMSGRYTLLVFFIVHVFAMSSTIYNPFLYAFMNDAFRVEFTRALPHCLVAALSSSPCSGSGGGGTSGGQRRRPLDTAGGPTSAYPTTAAAGSRKAAAAATGRGNDVDIDLVDQKTTTAVTAATTTTAVVNGGTRDTSPVRPVLIMYECREKNGGRANRKSLSSSNGGGAVSPATGNGAVEPEEAVKLMSATATDDDDDNNSAGSNNNGVLLPMTEC